MSRARRARVCAMTLDEPDRIARPIAVALSAALAAFGLMNAGALRAAPWLA